ncbi:P-loop NTPase fold protein [Aeromonas hydrophila]|uniref:KAP family P-loop NTPase fold protein n=1 Tax=Aeromonas hydrophila TaxID=644 RepID=UPI001A27785B|nr:P-loop NTPase fold protein [Aeromonas hydrophila]MCP3242197.1 P-loop NTPase fold protein [Aeromonas hydrophila]HAU4898116.1 NTPase [Aeromonas hydrophila]
MDKSDVHGFSSDRPISKVEEDLLGRAVFSKDLAEAIASWHGKDSLVVALHGDWGSGKSSIKNMAVSKLKELTENKQSIVDFSPWEWAAQEKITASFFQEISKSIGRIDKSKEGKKLSKTLLKYGRYLNTGESVVSGLSSALPTLFVLATITGIGGSFFDLEWIKSTSAIILGSLAAWAAALKWGSDILKKLGANTESTAKENEKGLSDIRDELSSLLSKRNSSLIVVMDDLDRLTSSQLRMVFQLVKANLELPNLVFLLLFQRDLVEDKLTDGMQIGRDYLEKIIQVPFDIPKIEVTRLHNLLFSRLDNIIEQDRFAVKMFDSGRWGNIFHGALHVYFNNLRNVYRYTSTLSFHFSLLKGKSAFEVNPVDLIAIECLRVFEPDVYSELVRSKKILTKNGRGGYGRNRETTAEVIEGIIGKSEEHSRQYVRELLRQIFPTIEWALGGIEYAGDYANSWLKEMRVCHSSNFDKYFQFSIPTGELSNSDLQDMLSLTSDSEAFASFILSLKERGILKNALSQFEYYTDQIPIQHGKSYIKALLDIGDIIDHESIGFTMFSSNTHAVRLVVWFLRRIKDIDRRGTLLLSCFKASEGISVVEHILQGDENRREKSDPDIVLGDSAFSDIKKEFVSKLDSLADKSPNTLITHEHLASFLYRWKRWGNSEKVVGWLKSQTNSPNGCINLLNAFITKSSSQGMGDYIARVTSKIKLEDIECFIEIEPIQQMISGIDINCLDDKSKESVLAFNAALGRREKTTYDE